MTKQEILEAISLQLENSEVAEEGTLNQEELTIVTDELAVVLETVNPDRRYPSTPV